MFRKVPLIVILGSTGTGKTKLSLELAERFGGEIISADSMQVYANLDIVTAKATREEQSRARHHLLDIATPAEPFTVVHFRNAALPILDSLIAQSKCPIVVGGTNYYIESLLWDILVSPKSGNDNSSNCITQVSSASTPSRTEVKHADRKSSHESVAEAVTDVETTAAIEQKAITLAVTPATTTTTTSSTAPSLSRATSDAGALTSPENNAIDCPFLTAAALESMSSELLHQHLVKIDPVSAQRIHPNNKRKITRAIEVFQQTGKTLTSILEKQRQQPGANRLGGPLRYPHTILFWLRCNQDVLNERLDKRVDSMLEQGLLREVRDFHVAHMSDKSASGTSFTKGVLQTIGFKEFLPYLEKYDAANDREIEAYLKQNGYQLPGEEVDHPQAKKSKKVTTKTQEHSLNDAAGIAMTLTKYDSKVPQGLDLLRDCLNELKLVTKRYSKKQIKWINNRFLASKDRQVPDLYELDTSNVSEWQEKVLKPAITVIECYRTNSVCEVQPMEQREHPGAGLDEETSHYCEICQRHFIGEFQWQIHLSSNRHKKCKDGLNKPKKIKGQRTKEFDGVKSEIEVMSTEEREDLK